jgi:hypothetical protein
VYIFLYPALIAVSLYYSLTYSLIISMILLLAIIILYKKSLTLGDEL